MRYLLPLLLFLAASQAMSADHATVAVSSTTPTNIIAQLTTPTPAYRSIMVENGDTADAIYCSLNPSVTTNNGHKVTAGDGWRGFPNDGPIYCISANDDQTGSGRNHTIVWGSYQ